MSTTASQIIKTTIVIARVIGTNAAGERSWHMVLQTATPIAFPVYDSTPRELVRHLHAGFTVDFNAYNDNNEHSTLVLIMSLPTTLPSYHILAIRTRTLPAADIVPLLHARAAAVDLSAANLFHGADAVFANMRRPSFTRWCLGIDLPGELVTQGHFGSLCSICLDSTSGARWALPCGHHQHHEECLCKWKLHVGVFSCPLCRRVL